ncbi:hypothetical protein GQ457_14G017290 [Hibiscus cannabinus]
MGLDDPEFDIGKLCKVKAPPKIKNFLWKLKLGRFVTKDFLKKRGILSREYLCMCIWCNLGVENVNHIFVGCSFAKNFLGLFCERWKVSWMVNCNVKELIDFYFEVSFTWTRRSLWLIFVASAFWSMWLSRKDKVFKEKPSTIRDILFHTKLRSLVWVIASMDEFTFIFDDWWDHPEGCVAVRKLPIYQNWSPPSTGWLKFNLDGASKEGAAGCRGDLRTKDGIIRALFSGPAPRVGANYAELIAIKIAL